LPQDCIFSACFFIGLFSMDENNDRVCDLFLDLLIRYLG
jgi:hypothetical protein